MNNGYMGMVRQWQELFWDRRYSSVEMGASPDWVKLAEAFGATGMRCENSADLEETMVKALETDGPVLLDVRVAQEENCYPMIPPGQAARDMVEAPEGGALMEAGTPQTGQTRGPARARAAERPQAHPLDPGREQAGRAGADRRALLAPRLQHRHARGRADRRPQRSRGSRSPSTAPSTRSTR